MAHPNSSQREWTFFYFLSQLYIHNIFQSSKNKSDRFTLRCKNTKFLNTKSDPSSHMSFYFFASTIALQRHNKQLLMSLKPRFDTFVTFQTHHGPNLICILRTRSEVAGCLMYYSISQQHNSVAFYQERRKFYFHNAVFFFFDRLYVVHSFNSARYAQDVNTRFSHYRVAPGDRIRRPEQLNWKTRLDAAVAMRVYSISAGRTLH